MNLLLKKKYGFLVHGATSQSGKDKDDWGMDREAISFLTNSLAHADIVVNMYSTFFIEGAIFDKPLIGIAFDGEQKLDFWNSAVRFFEWDHLADLKPLNGIWLVKSVEKLSVAIDKYLTKPAYQKEGREKIVQQQCQFIDGNSGKRLAQNILDFLKG